MNFKHQLLPRVEIVNHDLPTGRVYDTPDGRFRSVTTIIGDHSDKSWLDDWRARVGKDEADQILHQAGVRGTAVHGMAEKYVMNDPSWSKKAMPVNLSTFKKIRKVLDKGLELVYGVEFPLWSTLLKTAGRSDLTCVFAGHNSIVDFKNTRRTKEPKDLEDYFIQGTAYALMFEERTGVKVSRVVVINATDDEPEAAVYVQKPRDWYHKVGEVFCGSSLDRTRQGG